MLELDETDLSIIRILCRNPGLTEDELIDLVLKESETNSELRKDLDDHQLI